MSDFEKNREPMLDIFIYETNQLLEQLEEIMLRSEKNEKLLPEDINEIFRIMHTIKGSSAMMAYSNISSVSHAVEDLFDYIRKNSGVEYKSVFDVVFSSLDFVRGEMIKIQNSNKADGNEKSLIKEINQLLDSYKNQDHLTGGNSKNDNIKDSTSFKMGVISSMGNNTNKYIANLFFEDGCLMENVRSFSIVYNLKDRCSEIYWRPNDIDSNNSSCDYIQKNGFKIYFSTEATKDKLLKYFDQTLFLKSYNLKKVDDYQDEIADLLDKDNQSKNNQIQNIQNITDSYKNIQQTLISVNISKLDKLMNIIGEIVIAESMVEKNPDLEGLELENFHKATRQLKKLIEEMQDSVMSVRMVPIEDTFNKMQRIVRDMGKKLDKKAELFISGEETEVDKNIINHISDPLMHIIRNAMDHGIESVKERIKAGKSEKGKISLSACNSGGEVIITIIDDGKGLDRKSIIQKAKSKGLLNKPAKELSNKEVFSYILKPGFSTKDKVTEYSGRGVGMDVVKENIEKVGGVVFIDSEKNKGMTVTIKIPLTLAIIDGMKISVGSSIYTIPTTSIKEFFKAEKKDLVEDTQGNEMIMIRGDCYPVLRLHKLFNIKTDVVKLTDGVMVLVEWENKNVCLFADELIGEQSVVTKPLPNYLDRFSLMESGIGGCTILGDGNISLIIDVMSIINRVIK